MDIVEQQSPTGGLSESTSYWRLTKHYIRYITAIPFKVKVAGHVYQTVLKIDVRVTKGS